MKPNLRQLRTSIECCQTENDAILEFEQCASNSNIPKIECMKSGDKQITLSMISMFVGENNAIKMTQKFNEAHAIKATSSSVQYLAYIIKKEFKELSNGEL